MKTFASLYRKEFFEVPTPSYVIAKDLLEHNLRILHEVEESTGAHVLLAQKCFSMYHYYPLIAEYLSGTTASGLYEARLGHEEMGKFGKETHVFSPAYKEAEFAELTKICGHIVFNSFAQWKKFGPAALAAGVSCGLRINPERSTQDHAIYDPCAAGSRLGVRLRDFDESAIEGLEGLHFHTLCEQGADALAVTLEAVEAKFGKYLPQMKWINFGGGHHITKEGYDIALLKKCIRRMQQEYGLTVYIEPGEAVALNAGFLVAEVLDIQQENAIAILAPRPPATCLTSSRCPTARPSLAAASRGRRPIPTLSPARPASPATPSAPIPSTIPSPSATASSSVTWPSTPWSRTTPSTACPCPPSSPATKTAAGRLSASSATKTSR